MSPLSRHNERAAPHRSSRQGQSWGVGGSWGGWGLGQEGQEKGSTYATAYSTGTHGKATHDLRPEAICVGVQGEICRCAAPAGAALSGGRASILKPVRATAAEAGCNRRLWMFGGRNWMGEGGGNFESNSRIIIVSEGLSAGQVCLRL